MCRHYLNLWSQPLSFSLRSIRTTLSFWFLYSPDVSMGWLASIKLHICRFFGILLFFIPLLGTSEPAVKKKKKTGLEEHYLNPKGHIDQIFQWSALSTLLLYLKNTVSTLLDLTSFREMPVINWESFTSGVSITLSIFSFVLQKHENKEKNVACSSLWNI